MANWHPITAMTPKGLWIHHPKSFVTSLLLRLTRKHEERQPYQRRHVGNRVELLILLCEVLYTYHDDIKKYR